MKKLAILLFMMGAGYNYAQENITFQKPSEEILKLADYQRPPSIFMDSKKETMIFVFRSTYKTLEELNHEDMKLAGLRIDPKTNISSTLSYVNNLKVKGFNDKEEKQVIGLPENAKLAYFSFSPDEKYLSFTHTTTQGVELWKVDLKTAQATRITIDNLNANMGMPYAWFKDSKTLIVRALPDHRAKLLDEKDDLPKGPTVATSTGEVSQNRTYQDMLKSPLDEANFKTLTTSELVKVDINGNATPFAEKAIYSHVSISPNGEYVMVNTIHQPFSYMVPYYRFPFTAIIYNSKGEKVKEVIRKLLEY